MNLDLIDQLAHLIEQHGLSLILLILGIAWIYFWLMPKVNDIWKEYSNDRIKPENVDTLLEFDLTTKALLGEVRDKLGADWVQLWQFHNGTYNLGLKHIPFLYISISHEVTSDVAPMSLTYHALPTSFFKDTADRFMTDDVILTDDTSVPLALGAKTYCLLPIRNEEGHLAALLAIGYTTIHAVTGNETLTMKTCAGRLGIFLAKALKE